MNEKFLHVADLMNVTSATYYEIVGIFVIAMIFTKNPSKIDI